MEFKKDLNVKELLGDKIIEPGEDNSGCNLFSNGVYSPLEDFDVYHETCGIQNHLIMANKYKENIYQIALKDPKRNQYWEYGYLFIKDDKPYIFCSIPGDDRGATVFNNTFTVSGHDGNCSFNISNPKEFQRS